MLEWTSGRLQSNFLLKERSVTRSDQVVLCCISLPILKMHKNSSHQTVFSMAWDSWVFLIVRISLFSFDAHWLSWLHHVCRHCAESSSIFSKASSRDRGASVKTSKNLFFPWWSSPKAGQIQLPQLLWTESSDHHSGFCWTCSSFLFWETKTGQDI